LNVLLRYAIPNSTMTVKSVHVIGSHFTNPFNMQLQGDIWTCEIQLSTGEHLYKFLINEELPVFDPYNNLFEYDENEELWSLLIIDEFGRQLFNPHPYHITLADCQLTQNTHNSYIKSYSNVIDPRIIVTIRCTNITGVHGITVAWYLPGEVLFEYSESGICATDEEFVSAMFWIRLDDIPPIASSGTWIFRLFLDGILVIEEFFSITPWTLARCKRKLPDH